MLPVKHFTEFIEQNNLFASGSKILAAVSGGMDSVLMAHLLKAAGYDFSLHIVISSCAAPRPLPTRNFVSAWLNSSGCSSIL